jgi:hypothetical protein
MMQVAREIEESKEWKERDIACVPSQELASYKSCNIWSGYFSRITTIIIFNYENYKFLSAVEMAPQSSVGAPDHQEISME